MIRGDGVDGGGWVGRHRVQPQRPVPALPQRDADAGQRVSGTQQHQNFLAKRGLTAETRGTGAQGRFLAGNPDMQHPARRLGLTGSRRRAGGAGGAGGAGVGPAVGPATTPQVPAPAGAAPVPRGPAVGQPLGISARAPVPHGVAVPPPAPTQPGVLVNQAMDML